MKPFEKSLKTLKNLSKLKDLPLKLAETGEPVVNTEYAKVDGEYKEYITVIEQHPNETILAVMGEDVAFRELELAYTRQKIILRKMPAVCHH